MILLIDNYDSFVHNLARYFKLLGQETRVVRNDEVDVAGIRELQPQAIVLSPGPCTPTEAGVSLDIVRELHRELPLLGICLGHQTIAAALGADVVRAKEPRHGRTSLVEHNERGVFAYVPTPLTVCRYHSLIVAEETLPDELEVIARTTDDQAVMALTHRDYPVIGLQFHPEAILTPSGFVMLANYLRITGIKVTADPMTLAAAEDRSPPREPDGVGLGTSASGPITF